MRIGIVAGIMASLLASGAAASTAGQRLEAPAASIEQMRARDRFASPKGELAAWQQYEAALGEIASPALRAEVQTKLAVAHFYARSYAEGWARVGEAERLVAAHRLSDAAFVPELLAYGSLLSTDLGELDRAADWGARALAAAREAAGDDSSDAALAYNSLAYVDFARGDIAQAKERMCAAADRARRHLPPTDAMVSNNLISCAVTRYYLDDPEAADAIRAAASFAHRHLPIGHPKLTLALNSSSGILTALGHYAEAEQVLHNDIALNRAHFGDDYPDLYSSLSLLGRVLLGQGKIEEAQAVLESAVALADRTAQGSDPALRGQARLNLAQLHARAGRMDRALALQQEGYAVLKASLTPDHIEIGNAEMGLASLLLRKGEKAEAMRFARSGRQMLRAGLPEHHKDRLSAELVFAEMLAASGEVAEAFDIARPAAEQLEKRLVDLAVSRSELVSLSPVMVAGFGRFAHIALAAGQQAEAVRAAHMANLSELNLVNAELAAREAASGSGAGALLDRLRDQKVQAGQLRRQLARAEAANDPEVGMISRKLDLADASIAAIEAEIEQRFPSYRELARPRPATLEQIRERLEAHQALILPIALTGRTLTILVGDSEVAFAEQAEESFEPLVKRIARSVESFPLAADSRAATFDAEAAHLLYRRIFPAALELRLSAYKELYFPPSGPLASLPPALLLREPVKDGLAGAAWLVRTHGAAILSDFGARPRAAPARKLAFLGVGDPKLAAEGEPQVALTRLFRGGAVDLDALRSLPALPETGSELRRMASGLRSETSLLLTGAEASESRLKTLDFKVFGIAAFATHGLTSGELTGLHEPALVLTPPAQASADDDGLLTASEIARLTIPADWVILSACNSGGGRTIAAPAYSGLARAFRLAGARSLLLSHWRVRDDAAARLSVETVAGAAGGTSRAESLRRAMVALMDDHSIPGAAHPALWAPFILIGD